MNPKIWGSSGWKFLYWIVLNYPDQPNFSQIHNYKRFFYYLQYVLPCQICCENYSDHIIQIPIDSYLINRRQLFQWLLKIQNLVNLNLNKQLLNESDIYRMYFSDKFKNENLNENLNDQSIKFACWRFLFSLAFGYPEVPSTPLAFFHKRFFEYLALVIPEPNYKEKSSQLPIDLYLENPKQLFQWVKQLHNSINSKKLGSHQIMEVYFKNKIEIKKMGTIEGFNSNSNPNPNPANINIYSINGHFSLALIIILYAIVVSQIAK